LPIETSALGKRPWIPACAGMTKDSYFDSWQRELIAGFITNVQKNVQ
jgi:hypothetical protein